MKNICKLRENGHIFHNEVDSIMKLLEYEK